jgi:hypothetical protein
MLAAEEAACIEQIVVERKQVKHQNKRKVDVLREQTFCVRQEVWASGK